MSEPTPQPSPADLEKDLLTLARLDQYAREARAAGGPLDGLRALLERPLSIGPFTLQPMTMSVFIFLQSIGSPMLTGGVVQPLDIARALLAFAGPERSTSYLAFAEARIAPDWEAINTDAFRLCGQIRPAEFETASRWIAAQIEGVERLLPEEAKGPLDEPAPAPETLQAPPDGSSLSQTS